MSDEIEKCVAKCSICSKFARKNTKEPLIPHQVPRRAWEKIGTDILQFGSQDYIVVVDYFSKWIELCKIPDKTAATIINVLKIIFARFGIPETVMSDNMPFASFEFKDFAREWYFDSVTSSPLYSQSNGMSERSVQIVKNILRKSSEEGKDPCIGLLEYRNTPIKGMDLSPAQMLFSRRLRTKLPVSNTLLEPEAHKSADVQCRLKERQVRQKSDYDTNSKPLTSLKPNESILLQKGKI